MSTVNVLFKILYKLKAYRLLKAMDKRFNYDLEEDSKKVVVMCGPITPWGRLHQRPQNFAKALSAIGFSVRYCILPYSNITIDRDVYGTKHVDGVVLMTAHGNWHEKIVSADYIYTCYPWQIEELKRLKRKFPNALHVHDVFDDMEIFSKKEKDKISYNYLIDNCDICLYSADSIRPQKKEGKLLYTPNGCDVTHFSSFSCAGSSIGYVGAISSWFDFDFVEKLAQSLSDSTFYLIGKVSDCVTHKMDDLVSSNKNIVYMGSMDYSKLPLITKMFDYSLIPFKLNNITLATSPIKMFEYLASGSQVISSNLPEVKKYEHIVFCVDTVDEAINIIRKREKKDVEKEVILGATWGNRLRDVFI